MDEFYLLVEMHREGSAPAALAADLFNVFTRFQEAFKKALANPGIASDELRDKLEKTRQQMVCQILRP